MWCHYSQKMVLSHSIVTYFAEINPSILNHLALVALNFCWWVPLNELDRYLLPFTERMQRDKLTQGPSLACRYSSHLKKVIPADKIQRFILITHTLSNCSNIDNGVNIRIFWHDMIVVINTYMIEGQRVRIKWWPMFRNLHYLSNPMFGTALMWNAKLRQKLESYPHIITDLF